MAIDYTVKEARNLIEQHKALLSDLEYVTSEKQHLISNIEKAVSTLVDHAVLNRAILNDCINPVDAPPRNAETERLILNLHKLLKARASWDTAAGYNLGTTDSIRDNIALLSRGIGGLSRLFGGKAVKENAARAYKELSRDLKGSYARVIPWLASEIESLDDISDDTAWQSFLRAPLTYQAAFEAYCPHLLSYNRNNPFHIVLDKLDDIEQNIARCQSLADKSKETIKAAADKMLAVNALQILRGIPVEELNRDKAGFRVKALRDAGITTMADIYSCSPYHLASINGISDNAALSIKRIAKQFIEEAHEGVKIKLSADDRNKQATELVTAVYNHRQKSVSREKLDKFSRSSRAPLNRAKRALHAVGSGVPWLFFTAAKRAETRAAYAAVRSITEGKYFESIYELLSVLMTDSTYVSADTVWADFQQHNIEYISILEEIVPGALGNGDSLYGLPEDLAREIQEEALFPDGLLCTLRRYQEWGVKYILHQKKVLLGDEMGLGKTVQAIATMVSLRNTGATHFMVICPASVVTNWCREVSKHSKLRSIKIHGSGRAQALRTWAKTGGVAVTTFETIAYFKEGVIQKIDLLTVDEAHYIKNPEARRSINVRQLCEQADRLLFMTGTALENKVEEMITLIDILQPKVAAAIKGMTLMQNAPQFRERIAPVYYRRKREDVLTELPELIEKEEWCTLNPAEKSNYETSVTSRSYAAARRLSWDSDDIRQSCKAARLLEIVEQAKAEGRKVLVFSFFLDTIRAIAGIPQLNCYGPINGSVPPPLRQDIIDSFDKAPEGAVLLAQIQSGGTGLNIQSASVVVICEPQLKPSIENQAISRAYRMGQSRNVLVHRLLCVNTIDEKITDLLKYKQSIFNAFADKSVAAEQSEAHDIEVDEKSLGKLIQEEIDRINSEKTSAEEQE